MITLLLPSSPHPPLWLPPQWEFDHSVQATKVSEYQLWAVEQRVTDRYAILPVVAVFSGGKSDEIVLEHFSLSTEATEAEGGPSISEVWAETKALMKSSGAKPIEVSPNTYLAVTSLPSLPPSLSLVQIPGGNFNDWFPQLYLNINLRRLGLGGRSSLSLATPSPAQQLHFRQAFRLPIPAVSLHSNNSPTGAHPSTGDTSGGGKHHQQTFGECVLELIRLVQQALSLFGLGAVAVRGRERDDDETGFTLDTGDGLLCDETLSSLSLFRVDIAEPLLHLPPSDSSLFLSPGLLAALLSIVLGTKTKLVTLGQSDVPKDPFEKRPKFLRSVNSFQSTHRLPFTTFLTLSFLSSLSSLSHKFLSSSTSSTTSKLTRTLKSPLPSSLNLNLSSDHPGSGSGSGGGEGEELETDSLEGLVESLWKNPGLGGGTITKIWGVGKEKRRLRLGRVGGGGGKGGESDSDGDLTGGGGGRARGVLKSVKERVKRAGGGGGGRTEDEEEKEKESWGVRGDKEGSGTGGLLGKGGVRPGGLTRQGSSSSLRSEAKFSKGIATPETPTQQSPSHSHSKSTFASRLSHALSSSDRESSSHNNKPSPKISITTHSTRTSPPLSTSTSTTATSPNLLSSPLSLTSIPVGPGSLSRKTTGTGGRRVASEGVQRISPKIRDRPLLGEFEGEGEEEEGKEVGVRSGLKGRRRHSFSTKSEAGEPWLNLSRKRLEMDVNLRMTLWELKGREKKMEELIEALQIVNKSYEHSLSLLTPHVLSKQSHLTSLTTSSAPLLSRTSLYLSTSTPLHSLQTGSSRNAYAISVLESKLGDLEDFKKRVEGMEVMKKKLEMMEKERSGIHRLVKVVGLWRGWLGYLGGRVRWNLVGRWWGKED